MSNERVQWAKQTIGSLLAGLTPAERQEVLLSLMSYSYVVQATPADEKIAVARELLKERMQAYNVAPLGEAAPLEKVVCPKCDTLYRPGERHGCVAAEPQCVTCNDTHGVEGGHGATDWCPDCPDQCEACQHPAIVEPECVCRCDCHKPEPFEAPQDLSLDEEMNADEIELEQEIAETRAELEALEAEAKEQSKNKDCTPEEHLQRAIRVGNLRTDLRNLEREREG